MSEALKYIGMLKSEVKKYYLDKDYGLDPATVLSWLKILKEKMAEDARSDR